MAGLSDVRKGEIAFIVLVKKVYKEGSMILSEGAVRNLPNAAKELGIPLEEFKEFNKEIIQELINLGLK